MKEEKYPKEIFIQKDENCGSDEEECFLAWENRENAEDGLVAVYELKELLIKETNVIFNEHSRD